MSKRGAEGERVGESHEIEDNSKMDVPRKANAAQMARRKIATAKGHRGSPAARARPISTPQTQNQNFGVNGTQQQNGFTFGAQSFGGTSSSEVGGQEQSQSASFPSFAPPSSQFNFSTTPSTNPFAQLNNTNQASSSTNGTVSTGFKGNIFNFPSSQPAPTQPAANGTSIFSNQQPLPQTSNLFGGFTQQQQPQSQSSNPFQFSSTPNQSSTPAEDKPEAHKKSNIFGLPSQPPSTPSAPKQSTSPDFSTLHSSQGATSPVDMMMSTSPDTSPKSVQQSPTKVSSDVIPPQNPFASLLPSKAPEPATTLQQNNSFSDIPKATPTTSASMPVSDTAPAPQKSGGGLFDRISYPDPTKDSESTKGQNTASAAATTNIFGHIATANASKDTNSLFVPETQQPASTTNTFGGLVKQDAQKGLIDTQESSSPASTGKSLFDRVPLTNQAESAGSTQTPNSSNASTQEKAPTEPKPLFSGFAPVNQTSSSSIPSSTFKSTSNIFASASPAVVTPAKDSIFTPSTPTSFGTSSRGSEISAPTLFQQPPSTNIPTAAQPSNSNTVTFPTSSSPAQSTASPPTSGFPSKDTSKESDKLRLIAWRRIKAINDGLQLMLDAPGADKDAILEFINARKRAVADAVGIKLEGTGSKRRAEHDEQPGQSPEKRTKFQQTPQQVEAGNQKPLFSGVLTNGIVSQSPFSPEKQPVGAKRKAGLADDQDDNDSSDVGNKRTRPDDIGTLKTLPANGSQTSQLFASIVGKAQDKPASTNQTTAPGATGFGGSTSNGNPAKSNSVPSTMFSKSTPSQPPQPSATSKPMFGNPTVEVSNASTAASSPSIFFGSQLSAGKVPPPTEPIASWNPPKCLPAFGSAPTKPPAVQQLPTFGAGGATNFLAQFGKKAEESEKRELEKRKAEDYDSEEDDLEEWKKRDAEKQAERRRQLAEVSKGKSTVFTPGGFMLSDSENARASSVGPESGASSRRPSDSSAKVSFTSVLDEPQPTVNGTKNIFAHLSDNDSAVEGSKHGDADDEETGSEGEAQSTTPKASTSKPSSNIFDRIGPLNNVSSDEAPKKVFNPFASAGPTSSIFGQGNPSDKNANPFATSNNNTDNTSTPKANPFAPSSSFGSDSSTPRANLFGASTSPSGDNTWKPDTPIKFGGQSATAPEVKISSPSPVKSNTFGNLFGGAPAPVPDSPSKAPTGVLGSSPSKPSVGFDFGSGKMNLGNSFLTPKANTLAPLPAVENSDAASRATSPGLSTAGESANESAADGEENEEEQLDLLSGADEEGEEKLFDVRAKALMFDPKLKEKDPEANVWLVKGVGPLRVLKNKETKATRILLRADPSGKIVLNAGLIKGVKYEHSAGKSVKFPVANEEKGLSTYMIRVGKDDDAKRLAEILEENKGD